MGLWDTYESRISVKGLSRRDATINSTREFIKNKIAASASYQHAIIDGVPMEVAITAMQDLDQKHIYSLPGEALPRGAIVEWADCVWLITKTDAFQEIYTKAEISLCNHLLRWIDDMGQIIEKWCIVEDGTKYLIGEREERIMSIGDARISVTITKDEDTNKLSRGRRFLIDDEDSGGVMAYQLTKPNKLFNVHGGKGVFKFILNEVNVTDNDNIDLRIADYYNWEPQKDKTISDVRTNAPIDEIVSEGADKQNRIEERILSEGRWL